MTLFLLIRTGPHVMVNKLFLVVTNFEKTFGPF
jgi:hypothetical protein